MRFAGQVSDFRGIDRNIVALKVREPTLGGIVMDMLVRLYALKESDLSDRIARVVEQGITVRRAMSYEKEKAVSFAEAHFGGEFGGWPSECDVAFANSPASCFIATYERRIVGFACYNSTCKGLFGPTGVDENFRKRGIGAALLLASLFAMKEDGYAYAVIGGADRQLEFYGHVAAATPIPGSDPGVYRDMLEGIEA